MNGITKEVIFHYFAGHATTLQKRLIEQWLREKANSELFFEWLEEWETIHAQFIPESEEAFAAFRGKINGLESAATGILDAPAVRFSFRRIFRKAAVAAAVLLALFFFRDDIRYRHYRTGNGEVRNILLSDRSTVALNANSDLRVSRFFNFSGSRSVSLSGEAIFDVRHDQDKRPFIVTTPNDWQIRVLGTEFNVYARHSVSRVFLNRGSLQLTDKIGQQPLLLKPGDLVEEDARKGIQRSANQSGQEFGSWKDHLFVFNATSLSDVARMLEDQFGKKVLIADTSLAARTISGSYTWLKEEDVLVTLSVMMKFNVIQLNDSIILK